MEAERDRDIEDQIALDARAVCVICGRESVSPADGEDTCPRCM